MKDAALAKVEEVISERDDARRERDEAVSNIKKTTSELEAQNHKEQGQDTTPKGNNDEDKDAAPKSKKRKHTRVFSNVVDDTIFKQTISNFIKSHIQVSQQDSFVTTQKIMAVFTKNGNVVPTETRFFKELRHQLEINLPTAVPKKINDMRGYNGISILDSH